MQDDLVGAVALHDPAILHDGNAVGQTQGLVEIMGDEDHGLVQKALQPQEFILHLAPYQRIQRREGFVQKPDVGFDDQRPGDADALLLAT